MEDKHGMARDRNSGFYVAPGDVLRFDVYSSVASLQVMLSGYYRDMGGEVKDIAIFVSPTSDRVISTSQQIIGGGFILSLAASLLSGHAKRGQCYCRASVRNSLSGQALPIAQLLGGYVFDGFMPSFPFGPIEDPTSGRGFICDYIGTNPAPGNLPLETCPAGALWRVISFRCSFTTDGNAGNRFPYLSIAGPDHFPFLSQPAIAQPASTSITYSWTGVSQGIAPVANPYVIAIPPNIFMRKDWFFSVNNDTGAGAGDDWGAPQFTVEEWIEPQS